MHYAGDGKTLNKETTKPMYKQGRTPSRGRSLFMSEIVRGSTPIRTLATLSQTPLMAAVSIPPRGESVSLVFVAVNTGRARVGTRSIASAIRLVLFALVRTKLPFRRSGS